MQDHYMAREPKFLWILLFIVTLPYANLLESNFRYIAFALLFVYAAAMMIQYELFFEEEEIRMEFKLLKYRLFEKRAHAKEIDLIQFIDLGRRNVIFVKKKDGKQMRLHRFKPENFVGRTRMFAEAHELKKEEISTKK
ncbi:hypothetical protein AJ85_20635 [Alkalihalobacillus alcalophilus ATCC 27647 = CGMCC 1.3604]|uniref:Uncharacterized protein n=1 Tax=Alkalihalobacillus alcalophilus ATCC 27647 = CGMCC 1.3604 TaxID=1218173 RepID=A0A094YQP2_ALKAL|nr:hypothetical protein [Alkalihalobacillus alcalophilus]KGA95747.1 hypothetical protein BALCAV_0220560 [Alkalihalobacillus alcalophilus ATCC 27647 = CGMCC 1.3604]MED1563638.1 hypothetical protein [Alkalihalobacillus alcalophilus]THG88907.1 hypothetical protein AJ85_20635 [Alkalihalobacillus alcalophilus ATCC 27647 = CGMCC 1.3604]